MKIGLDLINLYKLNVGLGRYAKQLIEGLSAFDKENEYFLFLNDKTANGIHLNNPNFHLKIIKTPSRKYLPWNQVYFFLRKKEIQNLDLFHSPVTPLPLILPKKIKTIVTLHDLSWKIFPKSFRIEGVIWWNFVWPKSLKKAAKIVAVSESAKRDIVKFYRLPENKIAVVHSCISFSPKEYSEERDFLKEKYNFSGKYILYLGALRKNKNLESLLKAFQILKNKKKIPHKLVIVGPKDFGEEKIFSEVKKSGLNKEIILTGPLPDNFLPAIYKKAEVFVFPSLYEGFGYPPLEAMVFGTPVAVSKSSSLPEIIGQAGLYFDPLDINDMADKIYQIISSPALAERLRNLGFKKVREFSMEKMIKKYLEVYKKTAYGF